MNLPISWKGKRVLIAGAGGGYDVYTGIPIAIELVAAGNEVFFANYSFTYLKNVSGGAWITDDCVRVDRRSTLTEGGYFPEMHLARWLAQWGRCLPQVYCYSQVGVKQTRAALEAIRSLHQIDAVLVVDGGCDGVFRGDEYDLATPSMDSISIVAASLVGWESSYYVLTAFGTEGVDHGVSHAEALHRISDLNARGAWAGVCALVNSDPTAQQFAAGVRDAYQAMSFRKESIVVNSILAAAEGKFGYQPVTDRAVQSPVWVSPLTSMFWFLDLGAVARQKLFYRDILDSADVVSVAAAIEKHRPAPGANRPSIPI